jgi:excinuclease UvrABC nuclease subunit
VAIKSFNINIEGYWRDKNKEGVPIQSGVYFVYEANYNKVEDTVTLLRLIYIGEANDVRLCIKTHTKYSEWLYNIKYGNELCFSTGYLEETQRKRVEAAYIFKHKPPLNVEFTKLFPFEQTTIISTGKTALLDINFTINQS